MICIIVLTFQAPDNSRQASCQTQLTTEILHYLGQQHRLQVCCQFPFTIHVISQCSLKLCQSVSPGTELQETQTQRDAGWRHDQVGVVLCLCECLVEADAKLCVQIIEAVAQATVAMAVLQQPQTDEHGSHRQLMHDQQVKICKHKNIGKAFSRTAQK